jgi:hypothetical protein
MRTFAQRQNQSQKQVSSNVRQVLRSPGQTLGAATRAFMEPRFGHDFSRVRVHIDSQAAASAQDVGALAYTAGRDIVFAQGQFAPHTLFGRRLLAHELAHTVQQSAGADQVATLDLRLAQQNNPFEREAERASNFVLAVRARAHSEKPSSVRLSPEGLPTLRRQPKTGGRAPEIPPFEKTLPPKEEEGEKPPAPAEPVCKSSSDVPLPCSPKGLVNDDFLKIPGAPQEAFGFTITRPQKLPPPEVQTKPAGKAGRVVLQETKATQVSCESYFTKAGPSFWRVVPIDAEEFKQRGLAEKCGSSYFIEFRITPDGEKKIIEAEMEHCTDYKYAFDISLGCYVAVVNDLAKKGTQFPTHEAAVDEVTKRAGQKPDNWVTRYLELLSKSGVRDTKKWHTAVMPKGPGLELEVDRGGRCRSRFPVEINDKSYPQVGKDKHPTSDVIK